MDTRNDLPWTAISATAITAAGLLTRSPATQATPMFPLQPGCTQYVFDGQYKVVHGSFTVELKGTNGTNIAGGGLGFREPGGRVEEFGSGTYSGSIFTVAWQGGARGRYVGDVDDNGFAHGHTYDETGGSSAVWHSTTPLACAPPPPPPPPPPQGPPKRLGRAPTAPAPRIATVVGEDVDVYDAKNEPNGAGKVVGMLRVGQTVELVGNCAPQDWCEVKGAAVPTGDGWVWGHLQLP